MDIVIKKLLGSRTKIDEIVPITPSQINLKTSLELHKSELVNSKAKVLLHFKVKIDATVHNDNNNNVYFMHLSYLQGFPRNMTIVRRIECRLRILSLFVTFSFQNTLTCTG